MPYQASESAESLGALSALPDRPVEFPATSPSTTKRRTSTPATLDTGLREPPRRTLRCRHARCVEAIALAFHAMGAMRTQLKQNAIGMLNVARSGDLIKLLWWDGDGLCNPSTENPQYRI
jgi:hypothetical protein